MSTTELQVVAESSDVPEDEEIHTETFNVRS